MSPGISRDTLKNLTIPFWVPSYSAAGHQDDLTSQAVIVLLKFRPVVLV